MTASTFWAAVGAQLRRPEGTAGRIAGHAMRLANARANACAVRALGPLGGERILEIGCGPGLALRSILATDVARAIGIDHSPVMIAQAGRNNARSVATGRLRLLDGDFSALPIENGSVDAVLAVNVAYFMNDATALVEARRVLVPGGRLVLYATHATAMRNWRFAGPHSHRLFDDKKLRALLAAGGFAAVGTTVHEMTAGLGVQGLIAIARKSGADGERLAHHAE
ncbi:MAG: class I SAM-dependent methyltransferase [Hyphomicrobiales bacterium]